MVSSLPEPDPESYKRAPQYGRQKATNGKIPKKHQDFAHLIVAGMSQENAYRQAISAKAARATARSKGSVIANLPGVKAYIKELRDASWTAEALSYAEKRAYLAQVVRTPIGTITEMSPLATEVVYEENGSKKVKMFSKATAIAEDNKMAGDYYADREGLNINPFGWLIAMNKSNSEQIEDEQKAIEIGNGSIPEE